jgi:hypothetical protein
MTKCEICGTDLQDPTHRFCGGDRCLRVFMRHPEQERTSPIAGGSPGVGPLECDVHDPL